MRPIELLAFLHQHRVHLWPEGSSLRYRDPEGVLTPALVQDLRQHKPAILAILKEAVAPPGATPPISSRSAIADAHRRYEEAIADVARVWDGLHAEGNTPPWLPGEDAMDDAIGARFRAGDAAGAIRGIEAWRRAWLDHLAQEGSPRSVPPIHPAVQATARRLDAGKLIDLANDPEVPEEDREAYRAEVHARAQALIDEAEGRRPPPNRGVCEMFDRAAGRGCRGHRHWRSTAGVVVCSVCHPPAHPGLVAEWLVEGGAATG